MQIMRVYEVFSHQGTPASPHEAASQLASSLNIVRRGKKKIVDEGDKTEPRGTPVLKKWKLEFSRKARVISLYDKLSDHIEISFLKLKLGVENHMMAVYPQKLYVTVC